MDWKTDFRSKFSDGLAPALLLLLFANVMNILIVPVQGVFGKPGLLIYILLLLAVSVICLERSTAGKLEETWRAWYGAVGGMLGWQVVSMMNLIGDKNLVSHTGLLAMIMVALIAAVLWQRVLPVGPQIYLMAVMLNWTGFVLVVEQKFLLNRSDFFDFTLQLTFWLALIASLGALGWIMGRSKTRLSRLQGAVVLYFSLMMVIYVAFGLGVI